MRQAKKIILSVVFLVFCVALWTTHSFAIQQYYDSPHGASYTPVGRSAAPASEDGDEEPSCENGGIPVCPIFTCVNDSECTTSSGESRTCCLGGKSVSYTFNCRHSTLVSEYNLNRYSIDINKTRAKCCKSSDLSSGYFCNEDPTTCRYVVDNSDYLERVKNYYASNPPPTSCDDGLAGADKMMCSIDGTDDYMLCGIKEYDVYSSDVYLYSICGSNYDVYPKMPIGHDTLYYPCVTEIKTNDTYANTYNNGQDDGMYRVFMGYKQYEESDMCAAVKQRYAEAGKKVVVKPEQFHFNNKDNEIVDKDGNDATDYDGTEIDTCINESTTGSDVGKISYLYHVCAKSYVSEAVCKNDKKGEIGEGCPLNEGNNDPYPLYKCGCNSEWKDINSPLGGGTCAPEVKVYTKYGDITDEEYDCISFDPDGDGYSYCDADCGNLNDTKNCRKYEKLVKRDYLCDIKSSEWSSLGFKTYYGSGEKVETKETCTFNDAYKCYDYYGGRIERFVYKFAQYSVEGKDNADKFCSLGLENPDSYKEDDRITPDMLCSYDHREFYNKCRCDSSSFKEFEKWCDEAEKGGVSNCDTVSQAIGDKCTENPFENRSIDGDKWADGTSKNINGVNTLVSINDKPVLYSGIKCLDKYKSDNTTFCEAVNSDKFIGSEGVLGKHIYDSLNKKNNDVTLCEKTMNVGNFEANHECKVDKFFSSEKQIKEPKKYDDWLLKCSDLLSLWNSDHNSAKSRMKTVEFMYGMKEHGGILSGGVVLNPLVNTDPDNPEDPQNVVQYITCYNPGVEGSDAENPTMSNIMTCPSNYKLCDGEGETGKTDDGARYCDFYGTMLYEECRAPNCPIDSKDTAVLSSVNIEELKKSENLTGAEDVSVIKGVFGNAVDIKACYDIEKQETKKLVFCDTSKFTSKCEYPLMPVLKSDGDVVAGGEAKWCRIADYGTLVKNSPKYYQDCIMNFSKCGKQIAIKHPEAPISVTSDYKIEVMNTSNECVSKFGPAASYELCKNDGADAGDYSAGAIKYNCYFKPGEYKYTTHLDKKEGNKVVSQKCTIGHDLTGPYVLKDGVKHWRRCDCGEAYQYNRYNCRSGLSGNMCLQKNIDAEFISTHQHIEGVDALEGGTVEFYTKCAEVKAKPNKQECITDAKYVNWATNYYGCPNGATGASTKDNCGVKRYECK